MPNDTQLAGQQVAALLDAILSGFDRSDLRAMTRIELNEELDDIAGGDSLQDVGLSLIAWAERNGRVPELIAALGRSNPDNAQVQALLRNSAGWFTPAGQLIAAQPARQPARPAQAVKPAGSQPASGPPPAPASAHSGGSSKLLLPLLLAVLVVGALVAFSLLRSLGGPPQQAPAQGTAQLAAATAAPQPGPTLAPAAVAATAATTASAAEQRLAVSFPNQSWRVGDVEYQVLSADAARLNPQQTQLTLNLRKFNNGQDDAVPEADLVRLAAGDLAVEPQDWQEQCYFLLPRYAARDDCHLTFSINSGADAMTLKLKQDKAETSVPVQFSPAAPGSSPSATSTANPGGFTVTAPAGAFTQETLTYRIVSADAAPYDDTHTAVTFEITAANSATTDGPLLNVNMRLLEDDVPREPVDPAGRDCYSLVAAGATGACKVTFIVSSATQDLKLRFLPYNELPDLVVPIPLSRAAQ